MSREPKREDVLSVFAGLRPLAAPPKNSDGKKTKEISRSHKIVISPSNLVTITGGKWTTYRDMAEDVVSKAAKTVGLPEKECKTRHLHIHGYMKITDRTNFRYVYGSDLERILEIEKKNPELAEMLHPHFDYSAAEVVWAIREEMAHTVEDVIARRLRALFLDARASMDMAPKVAEIMAKELGKDEAWQKQQVSDFMEVAQSYLLVPYK